MGTALNCSLGLFQPEEVIVELGEIRLWHGIEGKLEKIFLKYINLLLFIFFKQTFKLYIGDERLFKVIRSKTLR